jgi:hypothetical protein
LNSDCQHSLFRSESEVIGKALGGLINGLENRKTWLHMTVFRRPADPMESGPRHRSRLGLFKNKSKEFTSRQSPRPGGPIFFNFSLAFFFLTLLSSAWYFGMNQLRQNTWGTI